MRGFNFFVAVTYRLAVDWFWLSNTCSVTIALALLVPGEYEANATAVTVVSTAAITNEATTSSKGKKSLFMDEF